MSRTRILARFFRITLAVSTLAIAADIARSQVNDYKFQTLDFPGASGSAAFGINNSGQVAGNYQIAAGGTNHGFLRTQGQFTTIDDPNASSGLYAGTYVFGISNSGALSGTYTSSVDSHDHGFLFSGGQFADFLFPSTPPGHQQHTFAEGVNTSGVVVGYYQPYLYESCGTFYGPLLHGWTLTGGSYTQIDFPGECQSQLWGINDAGQMVGFSGGHGFLLHGGTFSTIAVPGSAFTRAFGINSAGDVVGDWADANGNHHGFILKNGNFTTFDFPGATSTTAYGINDGGDIVGTYTDASGQVHGFITDPVSLVDPVPDLLSGPAVITPAAGAQLLATKGTNVQGVAADGVAQVVIRIQADNVGDQFTLTLVGQVNPDEDGALGNPGDTTFTSGQLVVTAVSTGSGPNGPNPPYAFAIYRAPKDFARQVSSGAYKFGTCQGFGGTDDNLACRSETLQVRTPLGNIITTPVTILRPPVVLIHGLWGDPSVWNNFSPLFSSLAGPDSRFYVGFVDYNQRPNVFIVSSVPDYSGLPNGLGLAVLSGARSNSLGFQYNAIGVKSQIDQQVQRFKSGSNPLGFVVAGVQTDIVAHSMGGDISRTLAFQLPFSLQSSFLSDTTFGQGSVHKLITIDTPHLGSPLATQLLQGTNSCVANLLAIGGMPTFGSVQIVVPPGPATVPLQGAVGDLADSPMSQALQNISSPGQHPLPTALIAGTVNGSNLVGLSGSGTAAAIRAVCSGPVSANLTPTAWPTIFSNQPNDAVVSLNSQLNGLSADPGAVFDGNVHSPGIEELGFTGPSVLDLGPIPNYVINLLNTFVSNNVFHLLNP